MQPDVVEGDDGVRRERGRGHPVLVGEIVAEEEQRAEVHGSRTKGHLDLVVALVGIADLHELTVRTDEDAAGRARRLDRGLDDQPHELVAVVRGAERLAEARDDVAQASAFRLQLVETGLQLERHLVERPPEERELVTALYGHTLLEVAPRDRACRVDEPANRADDCTTFHVCNTCDEEECGEEPDEQAVSRVPVGRVDARLRADHAERRVGAFPDRAGDEAAVAGACRAEIVCVLPEWTSTLPLTPGGPATMRPFWIRTTWS